MKQNAVTLTVLEGTMLKIGFLLLLNGVEGAGIAHGTRSAALAEFFKAHVGLSAEALNTARVSSGGGKRSASTTTSPAD